MLHLLTTSESPGPPETSAGNRTWAAWLPLAGLLVTGTLDLALVPAHSLWLIHALPAMLAAGTGRSKWLTGAAIGGACWLAGAGAAQSVPPVGLLQLAWAILSICGLTLLSSALRAAREQGRRNALTDPLTGLANVRCFRERLASELNRGLRSGSPLTLLLLDCDDFKQINDRAGHVAGDRLLCEFAEILRASVRSYDLAARLGGDEFAVILPGLPASAARDAVDRLRGKIRDRLAQTGWPLTLCYGIWTLDEADMKDADAEQFRAATDHLLLQAKAMGKDSAEFGTGKCVSP